MNIFVVDTDPVESARSLFDKHIVKMPLESAQLLSTNHRVLDGRETRTPKNRRTYVFDDDRESILYKATMMNHPCTVWTRTTLGNYKWLCAHGLELCLEYTRRYKKIHASQKVIQWCIDNEPTNIVKSSEVTKFALAMPEEYKEDNIINSYRKYYFFAKKNIASWKYSKIPSWFLKFSSTISDKTIINNPRGNHAPISVPMQEVQSLL